MSVVLRNPVCNQRTCFTVSSLFSVFLFSSATSLNCSQDKRFMTNRFFQVPLVFILITDRKALEEKVGKVQKAIFSLFLDRKTNDKDFSRIVQALLLLCIASYQYNEKETLRNFYKTTGKPRVLIALRRIQSSTHDRIYRSSEKP